VAMPEAQFIAQLRRIPSDELTGEQMEMIATWELQNLDDRHRTQAGQTGAMCPQCGSGNFATAGTRNAHGVFTTDKCFDCNYSARGPLPALGGRSAGKKATSHARQIDTGGGAGSMYLSSRSLPGQYAPRL
jgi:hypothetical protein